MNFQGNQGYGADQVSGMSLADLLATVEEAVEEFGGDAEVVLYQVNNGRGANFGVFVGEFDLFESDGEEDQ